MNHYPSVSAWLEWKKMCSVSLCSDKARSEITGFVGRTMAKCWRKPHKGVIPAKLGPDRDGELVQLFEICMHAVSKKKSLPPAGAKRWKDWLFGRAGVHRILLGSSAERLVRTTLYRKFRREELGLLPMVDFSTLVHEAGGNQADELGDNYQSTVDRLLRNSHAPEKPDVLGREELLEQTKAGKKHAKGFFETMTFEHRVVMLGIGLGLKPYGAEVIKVAGKASSTLQEAIEGRGGDARLASVPVPSRKKLWLRVRKYLPPDTVERFGKGGRLEIATWTLAHLPEIALAWGETDPRCAALVKAHGGHIK